MKCDVAEVEKNATLQRIMLDRFPETRGDQTPTRNRRESAAPSRSRYFPEAVAVAPAMGKELPSWLRTRPKLGLLLGSPSITTAVPSPWQAPRPRLLGSICCAM